MKTSAKRILRFSLGLIALGLIFFGMKNHFSDEMITKTSVSSIEVIDPSVRGSFQIVNANSYEMGLNAYFIKKDYKSAIEQFAKSDSPASKFFLGISLLQHGDFGKAKKVFQEVLALGKYFPHHLAQVEDVKWFLILAKMGNNEYENNRQLISDIDEYLSQPSEKYRTHAENLKNKLGSPLYALTRGF